MHYKDLRPGDLFKVHNDNSLYKFISMQTIDKRTDYIRCRQFVGGMEQPGDFQFAIDLVTVDRYPFVIYLMGIEATLYDALYFCYNKLIGVIPISFKGDPDTLKTFDCVEKAMDEFKRQYPTYEPHKKQ